MSVDKTESTSTMASAIRWSAYLSCAAFLIGLVLAFVEVGIDFIWFIVVAVVLGQLYSLLRLIAYFSSKKTKPWSL